MNYGRYYNLVAIFLATTVHWYAVSLIRRCQIQLRKGFNGYVKIIILILCSE